MLRWRWWSLIALASLVLAPISRAQESAPQGEITLRVWWVEAMYPFDNDSARGILEAQIAEFNQANDDIEVILRLKATTGDGALVTTIVAAQPVAPNAIPDLILIPRNDLFRASRSNLVQPLEDWIPASLQNDIPANVLALGRVGDTLYGLPYSISLEHSVYDSAILAARPEMDFEALLRQQQSLLFPGQPMPSQAVNDLLLAQYLALGGRLQDQNATPLLDEAALLAVLTFYSQGAQAGLFSAEVTSYPNAQGYWSRLAQGEVKLGVADSSIYLRNANRRLPLTITSLPSSTTQELVILDGWVWALTTSNPDQQMAALQWVEWLMNAENQADFTQAFGILPSRLRALRLWSSESAIATYIPWLETALILPLEQRNNSAALALQQAFESVLTGVAPQEAAQAALDGLQSAN
jgi:ABC-type glycerol-3-phosphate transport system substrate-binding protein